MCQQEYYACNNRLCDGFAQLGLFDPCENRPNCEISYQRVLRMTRVTESHCPNCRGLTRKERNKQTGKTREARKALARSVRAQEQKTSGAVQNAHGGVEHQAGSSTVVATRGAVGGGLDPYSGDSISNSVHGEPPWARWFYPEQNRPFEPNWEYWRHHQPRGEPISNSNEATVNAANPEPTLTNTQPNVSNAPHAPAEPAVRHTDNIDTRMEGSMENSPVTTQEMSASHKPYPKDSGGKKGDY